MNKQLIEQWISALRSGKYKQGKYSLKNDGKFCCLGVACDIYPNADRAFKTPDYPSDEIQHNFGIDSLHDLDKIVHPLVTPQVNWSNLTYYLAHMNDTLDWSFPKIADWLEAHLLPLANSATSQSK